MRLLSRMIFCLIWLVISWRPLRGSAGMVFATTGGIALLIRSIRSIWAGDGEVDRPILARPLFRLCGFDNEGRVVFGQKYGCLVDFDLGLYDALWRKGYLVGRLVTDSLIHAEVVTPRSGIIIKAY